MGIHRCHIHDVHIAFPCHISHRANGHILHQIFLQRQLQTPGHMAGFAHCQGIGTGLQIGKGIVRPIAGAAKALISQRQGHGIGGCSEADHSTAKAHTGQRRLDVFIQANENLLSHGVKAHSDGGSVLPDGKGVVGALFRIAPALGPGTHGDLHLIGAGRHIQICFGVDTVCIVVEHPVVHIGGVPVGAAEAAGAGHDIQLLNIHPAVGGPVVVFIDEHHLVIGGNGQIAALFAFTVGEDQTLRIGGYINVPGSVPIGNHGVTGPVLRGGVAAPPIDLAMAPVIRSLTVDPNRPCCQSSPGDQCHQTGQTQQRSQCAHPKTFHNSYPFPVKYSPSL